MAIDTRDLKRLKHRADHYQSRRSGHDADRITQEWNMSPRYLTLLVRNDSKSSLGEESKAVRRFQEQFVQDFAQDIETLKLTETLKDYMERLDQIFFFGLLTRCVAKPDKMCKAKKLVGLRVRCTPNRTKSAEWHPDRGEIWLWSMTYRPPGHPEDEEGLKDPVSRNLDDLLIELVEVMQVAWFDIFSKHDTTEYQEEIEGLSGDGWRIHHLNSLVMSRIVKWLPSPQDSLFCEEYQHAIYSRNAAVDELNALSP
ncbi:hypothetical protein JX266_005605 [Neoarthrinium moseri]|nr:hypothetical protein JX266_005605 [Neoarthrinium moseri]